MLNETIATRGHTGKDGTLRVTVNVGVPDADVAVVVHVKALTSADKMDANGWPVGFFERVAGSMPDLQRQPQGDFENRSTL
jgi:hypothetical protein